MHILRDISNNKHYKFPILKCQRKSHAVSLALGSGKEQLVARLQDILVKGWHLDKHDVPGAPYYPEHWGIPKTLLQLKN